MGFGLGGTFARSDSIVLGPCPALGLETGAGAQCSQSDVGIALAAPRSAETGPLPESIAIADFDGQAVFHDPLEEKRP